MFDLMQIKLKLVRLLRQVGFRRDGDLIPLSTAITTGN
jgi:hypothetical protein